MTLAEIGKRLGQHGLEQIASVARPETILAFAVTSMAPTTASTRGGRDQPKDRRVDYWTGARKSRLGIQSHCGRVAKIWAMAFPIRTSGMSAPLWYRSCSQALSANEMAGWLVRKPFFSLGPLA